MPFDEQDDDELDGAWLIVWVLAALMVAGAWCAVLVLL